MDWFFFLHTTLTKVLFFLYERTHTSFNHAGEVWQTAATRWFWRAASWEDLWYFRLETRRESFCSSGSSWWETNDGNIITSSVVRLPQSEQCILEHKRQAHEVLPIISWCSVTNVARRKEVQFQTNCFCILLSPACMRFFLEHNYHLEAAERAKKQKTPRSTMNQNPACYNFQWHVLFPCYSGTFRGTALITMFYSSNICMLLQQPVKLHKWEGGNKRKMKKDDRTARCSLFICSVTCRDCLDSHHHQAAACRSTLLMRTKHDGENNHQ